MEKPSFTGRNSFRQPLMRFSPLGFRMLAFFLTIDEVFF